MFDAILSSLKERRRDYREWAAECACEDACAYEGSSEQFFDGLGKRCDRAVAYLEARKSRGQ